MSIQNALAGTMCARAYCDKTGDFGCRSGASRERQTRLALAQNLFPILVLRVAGAKSKHGVGERIPTAIARSNANDHRAIMAPLDGIRIKIHPLCSELTCLTATTFNLRETVIQF
jgi:hypothetical protein